MSRTLIICEKPSVARDVANALPGRYVKAKGGEHYEGPDAYVAFAKSSGIHITFSPNGMALQGHSRAHLRHWLQKFCRPKLIGLSTVMGKSVVKTIDFDLGPIKGLSSVSPMRETSANPAMRIAGL